jgi:hypothetical protein
MITCPISEIARLDFEPDHDVRAMPSAERLDSVGDIANSVRVVAMIAIDIVALTKPELIAAVHEDAEAYGPNLAWFSDAKEAAELLRDILAAAEKNLAIALANVEGCDGSMRH